LIAVMVKVMYKLSVQKGFTLLEIMVALSIVGIALVSLLSLGNRSIGVHDRLQHITQATLLAQQKMAESEFEASSKGAAELKNRSGTFEEPFDDYSWHVVVAGTPLPAVRMVTVTVAWGDVERNETVDVTSFLF
jgi:general secretion pathway protein I